MVQSYRTLFGLKATDATPFSPGWWQIWRPNDPPLSKEAAAYGKTYLQNLLCNPPPPAQLVTVADYTGGVEVTRPRHVGSANSKLTLTLRRDDKHR